MRRILAILAVLAVLGGTLTLGLATAPPTVAGAVTPTTTVYDSTISPNPVSLASDGYQATQTAELGQQIALAAGTSRSLSNVVVDMESWACQSGNWNDGTCTTTPGAMFSQPITLNLYNVGPANAVGSSITSVTQTFNIPFRPSSAGPISTCAAPGDPNGNRYLGTDNVCHNGILTPVTFTFPVAVTVPDNLVYGVAINTTTWSYAPVGGTGGPYDSLNLALNGLGTGPTVGSDPAGSDSVYQNSATASNYCAPNQTTGTFRIDDGLHSGCWSPYEPAVQFNTEATCTTTCFAGPTGNNTNAGQSDSPLATIQHAVNTVSSGGTVHVAAGTYNENVQITHPLSLLGTNATVPATGLGRSPESVISTGNVTGNDYTVQVSSPGVTVDGFTLQQTAPEASPSGAAFGVQIDPGSNGATVTDNIITGMTTSGSLAAPAGNPIGVDVSANNSATPNNVTVARNLIENITSVGTQHRSAQGIQVGDSSSTLTGTGLLITLNHITNIQGGAWGSYGIIFNRPTSGAQVLGNTIDTLNGQWAHAVGLEGSTTSPIIANNAISGISATTANSADIFTDATNNIGVTTATVTQNSLGGVTSGGIGSNSTGSLTAADNWWGCATGPNTPGCSATGGPGPLVLSPWISSFTPDPLHAGRPGFWPTNIVSSSNTASITSAVSVQSAAGKRVNFTVTTSGQPVATVSASGMPVWLTLRPGTGGKAGTAKLTGIGPVGGGDFTFILHANNGAGPDTLQTFTVHVLAISSLASANFSRSGLPTQNFTITTTGFGTGVSITATLGSFQSGLQFVDNGNGTATLHGQPTSAAKTHVVVVIAASGASATIQRLAIGINN
jgi:hypothetical protein